MLRCWQKKGCRSSPCGRDQGQEEEKEKEEEEEEEQEQEQELEQDQEQDQEAKANASAKETLGHHSRPFIPKLSSLFLSKGYEKDYVIMVVPQCFYRNKTSSATENRRCEVMRKGQKRTEEMLCLLAYGYDPVFDLPTDGTAKGA
ncbi:hypothetical protein TURU_127921 [Turdus rufiventris]|nr:hypothetical protein TURU_127921 [Turdus rufiventris]